MKRSIAGRVILRNPAGTRVAAIVPSARTRGRPSARAEVRGRPEPCGVLPQTGNERLVAEVDDESVEFVGQRAGLAEAVAVRDFPFEVHLAPVLCLARDLDVDFSILGEVENRHCRQNGHSIFRYAYAAIPAYALSKNENSVIG